MKKLLLLIVSVVLIYSFSYAEYPPLVVQKSFDKKFPSATNISWGRESTKEWAAEFTFEGKNYSFISPLPEDMQHVVKTLESQSKHMVIEKVL